MWDKMEWTQIPVLYLTGGAQLTYYSLTAEKVEDYDRLKAEI